MKKYSYLSTLLLSVLLLSTGLQAQLLEGQKAKEVHPTLKKVNLDDDQQVVKFLKFEESEQPDLVDLPAILNETLSKNNQKSTNGLTVKKIKEKIDNLGYQQVQFQQYYKDIPVEMATSKVQVKTGKVETVIGLLYKNIEVNTTPILDPTRALTAIQKEFKSAILIVESEAHKHHGHDHKYSTGELVILKQEGQDFLSWKLDIETIQGLKRFFVDAHTGKLLTNYPLESNCHAASGTTNMYGSQNASQASVNTRKWGQYRLRNNTCNNEVEVHLRDWNSNAAQGNPQEYKDANNIWNNNNTVIRSAFQTYTLINDVVDYFEDTFERDSYDNAGGKLRIYNEAMFYDFTTGTWHGNNASMSSEGGVMKIGRGNSATSGTDDINSLDVIAHEFAHAVTGADAGLIYSGESGALNESFSDIFGTTFERAFENNQNPDWLIGEDLSIGQFRDMSNPKSEGNPDTYGGIFWVDDGSVHSNSGVQNFWFYLLVDGGDGFNDNGASYNISGIGLNKAADIAYRTLTEKLFPSSTYADARIASIEAAEDEYGPCSNEVIQVTNAWAAVGVGAQSTCAPDLTVINPTITSNPQAGATIEFSAYIQNTGGAVNGAHYLYYYLSDDAQISGDDTWIGSDLITDSSVPSQLYNTGSYTLPPSLTGCHYIHFITDITANITESNEYNNVTSIQFCITPKPDLVINNLQAPATATAGSTININCYIKNIGTASENITEPLGYFLSDDTVIDSGDTYIGTDYTNYLGVGGQSYENLNYTIPSNLLGNKYIIVKADINNHINESNENNNVSTRLINIIQSCAAPTNSEISAQAFCSSAYAYIYCQNPNTGMNNKNKLLQYKKTTESTWTEVPTSTYYVYVPGLSTGTYQYKFAVECSPNSGSYSDFSPIETFSFYPCKTGEESLLTEQQNTNFKIYPNPTQHLININIDGEETAETIRIYDLQGRLLKEVNPDTYIGGTVQIDLSDLQAGMYMIRINDTHVEKITKL